MRKPKEKNVKWWRKMKFNRETRERKPFRFLLPRCRANEWLSCHFDVESQAQENNTIVSLLFFSRRFGKHRIKLRKIKSTTSVSPPRHAKRNKFSIRLNFFSSLLLSYLWPTMAFFLFFFFLLRGGTFSSVFFHLAFFGFFLFRSHNASSVRAMNVQVMTIVVVRFCEQIHECDRYAFCCVHVNLIRSSVKSMALQMTTRAIVAIYTCSVLCLANNSSNNNNEILIKYLRKCAKNRHTHTHTWSDAKPIAIIEYYCASIRLCRALVCLCVRQSAMCEEYWHRLVRSRMLCSCTMHYHELITVIINSTTAREKKKQHRIEKKKRMFINWRHQHSHDRMIESRSIQFLFPDSTRLQTNKRKI